MNSPNKTAETSIIDDLIDCYVKIRLDQRCLPKTHKKARYCIGKLTECDSTHIRLNPYVEFSASLDASIDKSLESLKRQADDFGNSADPAVPKQFSKANITEYEQIILFADEGLKLCNSNY